MKIVFDMVYTIVKLSSQHDWDIVDAFYEQYLNYDPFRQERLLSTAIPTEDIAGVQYPELAYNCQPMLLEHIYILPKQDILQSAIAQYSIVNRQEDEAYFYHGDHLGSAHWITDGGGMPIQYIHYAPYGELITNQAPYGYDERYKFTGKERDSETGYDFFGARYWWIVGTWLSVDPLADKYPGISAYAYCHWNPIKFVDPDGRDPVKPAPIMLMGTPEYYQYRNQQYMTFHKTTDQQSYYVPYGYKYAQKFSDNSTKFSKNGQQWCKEVMINLQKAMESRLSEHDGTDLELNSEDFQNFAFDSHVNAYWNIDGTVPFYDLEITDYWQIFQIIDMKDLVSQRGVKQEIKLGEKYIKHFGEELQKSIIEFLQILQRVINLNVPNEN